MKSPSMPKARALLATTTNEPFQPVRLYYAIPDRAFVTNKLRRLKCVLEVPPERCWQWLFAAESSSLRFPGTYDDVPKEKRPIVLGRLRFPDRRGMTFETNSLPRAVEGARFFGPRLGPEVVAMRCRLVNRCFAADEGAPNALLKTLDHDVTVIDPRVAEEEMRRELAATPDRRDPERAAAEFLERRLKSKKDVPMVEDFPLVPEEETPDFHDLNFGLQLRLVRAVEHWRGNTELTLTAIIMRAVESANR